MSLLSKVKKFTLRLRQYLALRDDVQDLKILQGKILFNLLNKEETVKSLHEVEFKVFSQFGDDGIIQYLINTIQIPDEQKIFVEFGVEDYSESNTRFLLMNNNWTGLIIDGSERNITKAKNSSYYWKHELTAVAAFIDRDNINDLISQNNISGQIALLSVDIDGNDYWVWERISVVDPIFVIAEYNSVFGGSLPVTIPYDQGFWRNEAHYSNLYWGCSLAALCKLAESKGYGFIGCNSAGNNAYFIRKDKIGNFKILLSEEGYVRSKFRESRDPSGKLTYLHGEDRLKEIADMKLVDLSTNQTRTVRDLYKLK